jgi:hypothetical protein
VQGTEVSVGVSIGPVGLVGLVLGLEGLFLEAQPKPTANIKPSMRIKIFFMERLPFFASEKPLSARTDHIVQR